MEDFDDFGASRGLKIHETKDEIVAEAVVAGVPAKNVDVHIEDGVLTIKAEIKEEEKTKTGESMARFRYYYSAAMSGGQWNRAKATVKHGVVTVRVPKSAAAKPQKVSVAEEKE
jgi:HSP20 family protein